MMLIPLVMPRIRFSIMHDQIGGTPVVVGGGSKRNMHLVRFLLYCDVSVSRVEILRWSQANGGCNSLCE
ncbi:GM17252 [Drosophila sechellia]|uniref:GM17252 n=1 Tax=Drosophila sechellia TaxID=7238 RepID=B4I5D2_DROSE|nr:GM17252 [Drosophila sechellia]